MKKYPLIGASIIVVVLILASLSNVVGFQTVQSSNQKIINEEINQRELLFQTILDIANNKEIQRIILKSQMSRGIFPVSDIPVITKNQLKHMYLVGLMLSKIISKSKIHMMIKRYKENNQELQKEISAVIEKDVKLRLKTTQLQYSECDCENENTTSWHFPIVCLLLYPIVFFSLYMMVLLNSYFFFQVLYCLIQIDDTLHCSLW